MNPSIVRYYYFWFLVYALSMLLLQLWSLHLSVGFC